MSRSAAQVPQRKRPDDDERKPDRHRGAGQWPCHAPSRAREIAHHSVEPRAAQFVGLLWADPEITRAGHLRKVRHAPGDEPDIRGQGGALGTAIDEPLGFCLLAGIGVAGGETCHQHAIVSIVL